MVPELLRERLALLQARNPRYSLRAFARDLHMHHGTLSQILRGRRHLSSRHIRALGERLRLDANVIVSCCQHEIDATILSLLRRPDPKQDSRWIASRTGIPLDEVNAALHRLLRTGALQMVATDHWRTHD